MPSIAHFIDFMNYKASLSLSDVSSIFRLLDIIWKRSMNPLLYYDSIYSLTRMKKQEDSYRQFIFEFISNEWNELLLDPTTDSESMQELSFIHQLRRISNNGRNYSKEEVNDHVGTMLVAVSLLLRFLLLPICDKAR
jgi:hypothetical protein